MSLTNMKSCAGSVGYLWILLATPAAAATTRIYVTNNAGTTIDVIDPATNKVVDVLKNFEAPEAARFSPDGSRIYITHRGEMALVVLDRKTGKVIKRVPLPGHRGHLDDAAVTSDGKLVVVCVHDKPGALDIVDTTSLERIASIPLQNGLHDVVLTGDDKYAIAGSQEGKSLTIIDLQNKKVAWDITFDKTVLTMAVENNPDGSGRRIFTSLSGLNGFAVIDFATHKEVTRVNIPGDLSGHGGPASPGPSHGIAVAPDGKSVWVSNRPTNAVYVYSLPELEPLGHAAMPEHPLPGKDPIGSFPFWMTFTPDSKTVYVSDAWLKTVSVLDAKTMKVVANIPVGERPVRISTMVAP
jgi:YVTN family beta-propeller protein